MLNLSRKDNDISGMGAGVAMIVGGIAALTVQYWAGANHTINGINYANVWHTQIAIIGWLAILPGAIFLATNVLEISFRSLLRQTFDTESPF